MLSSLRSILAETLRQWSRDHAGLLAAALSFYTLFSLAPLVLISISVAGTVLGVESARGRVYEEIERAMGSGAAELTRSLVVATRGASEGRWSTVIGLAILLVAASAVFAQLQAAMNIIWNVEPDEAEAKREGFGPAVSAWIRRRLSSFLLVIGAGFVLVALQLASSGVNLVLQFADNITPFSVVALHLGDIFLSIFGVWLVFGLTFAVVPETKIGWREVWLGAFVTSILFNVGKFALAFYLDQRAFATSFGAAGAVIALLIWVYYACQVFLFGAELTQVISDRGLMRSARKRRRFEWSSKGFWPRLRVRRRRTEEADAGSGSDPPKAD